MLSLSLDDKEPKLFPGEPRNPNYQIEVSHANCKRIIRVNYDTFMSITLDESGPDEPNSEKKGKKRGKAYQILRN